MSVAEVKALPWWEYEMLLEGMRTELAGNSDDDSSPDGYQPMGLDQLGITPQRVT